MMRTEWTPEQVSPVERHAISLTGPTGAITETGAEVVIVRLDGWEHVGADEDEGQSRILIRDPHSASLYSVDRRAVTEYCVG